MFDTSFELPHSINVCTLKKPILRTQTVKINSGHPNKIVREPYCSIKLNCFKFSCKIRIFEMRIRVFFLLEQFCSGSDSGLSSGSPLAILESSSTSSFFKFSTLFNRRSNKQLIKFRLIYVS